MGAAGDRGRRPSGTKDHRTIWIELGGSRALPEACLVGPLSDNVRPGTIRLVTLGREPSCRIAVGAIGFAPALPTPNSGVAKDHNLRLPRQNVLKPIRKSSEKNAETVLTTIHADLSAGTISPEY